MSARSFTEKRRRATFGAARPEFETCRRLCVNSKRESAEEAISGRRSLLRKDKTAFVI